MTEVHVFPGVPHGFPRWPELATTKVYHAQVVKSVDWVMCADGVGHRGEAEWQEHYGS